MQHVARHNASPRHNESFSLAEPASGYNTAYGSPGSGHWDQDGGSIDQSHSYPPPGHVPGYVSVLAEAIRLHANKRDRSGQSTQSQPTQTLTMGTKSP